VKVKVRFQDVSRIGQKWVKTGKSDDFRGKTDDVQAMSIKMGRSTWDIMVKRSFKGVKGVRVQ